MRGSISTAVQCFAFSNIRTVKFPVPGPTSRTLSVGRRLACIANEPRIGIVEEKKVKTFCTILRGYPSALLHISN